MKMSLSNLKIYIFLLIIFFLLGCASSGGSIDVIQPLDKNNLIKSQDTVSVNVHTISSSTLSNIDAQRLSKTITTKVDKKKIKNTSTSQTRKLLIDVAISRYDEGSRFARFMLAGLGQIHIDGRITLKDLSTESDLCCFLENKTFAWGGLYGASTGIEDVEEGFAEAIANQLTSPD